MEKCLLGTQSICHTMYDAPVCDRRECEQCGFNPTEAERRKAIPLQKGPDGRWCKHVKKQKDGV